MPTHTVYFFLLPFIVSQALAIFLTATLSGAEQLAVLGQQEFDWISIVISVILFAALFFLFKRFFTKKAAFVFRILFIASIFFSFEIVFSAFALDPLLIFLSAGVIAAAYMLLSSILVHDVLILVSFSAIASVMGMALVPMAVIFLLAALSLYDIIAVYKTRHMQEMARAFIGYRVIPAFSIPAAPAGFLKNRQEVVPSVGDYFIIGGGDVVLPTALTAAVFRFGTLHSVIVGAFVVVGAAVTYGLFRMGKRMPIPALPPLSLFGVLGYLLGSLFL